MAMHQSRPKSMMECSGPECPGCSSGDCYAKGGRVDTDERGINHGTEEKGVSTKGYLLRSMKKDQPDWSRENSRNSFKAVSKENIDYNKTESPKNLYAEGGEIRHPDHEEIERARKHQKSQEFNYEDAKKRDWDKVGAPMKKMADGGRVKGVHKSIDLPDEDILPGTSRAGVSTKAAKLTTSHPDPAVNKFWNKSAKLEHGRVLGEIRDMKGKDRSGMGYAEGGEVGESDEEGEHELRHAMGGELMDALDRKDHKGIMDALEACVLSIKGRHE